MSLRPVVALAMALIAFTLAGRGALAQDDSVERARQALARSNYDAARKELDAIANPRGEALLLKTRLALWTGRYADAVTLGRRARGTEAKVKAAPWLAEALARQGKITDAIDVLREVEDEPGAFRVLVVLGELLIKSGKRTQGEQALMKVINAYDVDIKDDDAEGLSLVGRAAHAMRAYRDANRAYDEAERAGGKRRVETLLWRADLFLDKYDAGHAAEVTDEALALAPNDPRALVTLAHVRLDQALAFDEAEALIARALAIDPTLSEAHVVRAGLALRVMDLAAADAATSAGLRTNPKDLELLSMRAATRFLADDRSGFLEVKKQVLELNPHYAQFFSIVGEFAEWEHRYDEIVTLMREAVAIDDLDAKAYATLGLNLIRNGDETDGLAQLRKAWKRDSFNARVLNTLELYEKTIAKDYVTVDGTTFRLRYHKREKPILERYVPRMLERAWSSMVKRYGFTPKVPIGIELYADDEHFSVRTSGLPNVGIQGVCFGNTLAALSPSAGSFNWGMILWHELAHVFHIQMSKNRVPRWFTEGLAEYETIIQRPEWQREEHLALYQGLRDGRLPRVASFNRAFTHVDDPLDVTMAYFAASQIAVFLGDEFGFDKVVKLLPSWGEGKPTAAAVPAALGIDADELDRRFRAWLTPRLDRYRKQYVPDLRAPSSVTEARRALASDPDSAAKHVKLALALLQEGNIREAAATVKLALRRDPKQRDALYLELRLALRDRALKRADDLIKRLLAAGGDGYALRMKAADVAELRKDRKAMRTHFMAAHRSDVTQAEPLQALYDLARKAKDQEGQLFALRKLSQLDQHDRRVWNRLIELLAARGYWDELVKVGQAAIYVDVANPRVHWLYAQALARSGKHVSAIFELNSAIKARPNRRDAAAIYRMMAAGYKKLGRPKKAAKAERYAAQMAKG
jgi:tetratricopeptide (TPR) repeat protein